MCCVAFGIIACGDDGSDDAEPPARTDMMIDEPECTNDNDCNDPEYCDSDGACATGCRQMPDNCDEGFSCRDTRVCVSDAECAIDNDCEADSYCLEGVCERGCRLEPDSCSEEDGYLKSAIRVIGGVQKQSIVARLVRRVSAVCQRIAQSRPALTMTPRSPNLYRRQLR